MSLKKFLDDFHCPNLLPRRFSCGRHQLLLGERTLLMGILNVTPDSFSDGGRFTVPRKAVAHALAMEASGADLIDLGGQSTRPGARPVSAREELRRLLPVLERLSSRLRIPLSVDTSKAVVAEAVLKEGASLINDVTALRDPKMAEVVARGKVPVILMHMRGTPQTMRRHAHYRRPIPEIMAELIHSIRCALNAGIARERILIDPGLGFSKKAEDNLVVLKNLHTLRSLGFPIVIGPSRKSFLGKVLGVGETFSDRIFGTAAAVACGVFAGADIVRVHDVAAMRPVVRVSDAIRQAS